MRVETRHAVRSLRRPRISSAGHLDVHAAVTGCGAAGVRRLASRRSRHLHVGCLDDTDPATRLWISRICGFRTRGSLPLPRSGPSPAATATRNAQPRDATASRTRWSSTATLTDRREIWTTSRHRPRDFTDLDAVTKRLPAVRAGRVGRARTPGSIGAGSSRRWRRFGGHPRGPTRRPGRATGLVDGWRRQPSGRWSATSVSATTSSCRAAGCHCFSPTVPAGGDCPSLKE
jgi:hypothetical protein